MEQKNSNYVSMGRILECNHCFPGKYAALPASVPCTCQCHDESSLVKSSTPHNDTEGMEERYMAFVMSRGSSDHNYIQVNIDAMRDFISQEIKRSQYAILDRVLEKQSNWGNGVPLISAEDIQEIRKGLENE